MRTRILFVALALAAGACASATTDGSTVPTTQPQTTTVPAPTSTTAPPPTEIPPSIDWEVPQNVVTVGVGWAVGRCEGEAPMLCISRDGDIVGVVEWFIADPFTYDVYDPDADDDTNLRAIANAFIDSFVVDRAAGCGAGYVVDPIDPEPIELRDGSGLVYGFRGTMSDGTPSELHLQYRAISQGRLILLAAGAYDEGGCPGKDETASFDSAGLEAFRPHLELLLSLSPLPGGDAETGYALPEGSTFVWVVADDDRGFVVDPVRFLFGDEANEQAIADGDIPPGEELPNAFYIHNPSEDAIPVRLADDVTFTVIGFGAGGALEDHTVDRDLLRSVLAGTYDGDAVYGLTPEFMPFELTVANGRVVEVKQFYLP